jgi:hypothetical protein
MDMAHHQTDFPTACAAQQAGVRAPHGLRLISSGLRLAEPVAAPHSEWDAAFGKLRDWLGIALDPVAAPRALALRKVTGWARGIAAAPAPHFAPWHPLSPVALQAGHGPELPRADWVVSYLFDHGPGSAVRGEPLDLALFSPHPYACASEEEGAAPMPRLAVLEAILRAARTEGRTRLAIIVPARQRNAMARLLLLADRELTREGITLEVQTIETALGALHCIRPRWDGLIVMPELRSIVFALLGEGTGCKGPWPMVWHDAGGDPVLVTSESLGEPGARLPLDAPVLMQTLALTLHHAGMRSAARRLHDAAARLRASGVVTSARGSTAPYAKTVSDAELVELVCAGMLPGHRPAPQWRALGTCQTAGTTSTSVRLNIISSTPSPSCP